MAIPDVPPEEVDPPPDLTAPARRPTRTCACTRACGPGAETGEQGDARSAFVPAYLSGGFYFVDHLLRESDRKVLLLCDLDRCTGSHWTMGQ